MTALLSFEGLEKNIGARNLFRIRNLDLERGASYVLTGDNGAGKTTLLKALAGLEPARFGAIHYQGRAIGADYLAALRRDVVYVHQHPYLFDTSITADFPQCGFSANAVRILNTCGVNNIFTVNVLEDPEIRQGIKEFSSWPTVPQLYVNGEFIGGSDIMTEMFQSGELKTQLDTAKVTA